MIKQKAFPSKVAPIFGLAFIAGSWFAANAGAYAPIIGVLVAALAPNLFLVGVVLISVWLGRILGRNKYTAFLWALAFTILGGLNTRIPDFLTDLIQGDASKLRVESAFKGTVGQPIHFLGGTELQARKRPYSSAQPACYGDGCLATKGFSTVAPATEADYWHENVAKVVLSTGFSEANAGETAPTLVVKQSVDEYLTKVNFELMDVNGKVIAVYDARFRNGFQLETKDGVKKSRVGSGYLRLEYLLHGNLLNTLASGLVSRGEHYPLNYFLKAASSLSHPQGTNLGFPKMKDEIHLPSSRSELEVLEERVYEPARVIKAERGSAASEWSAIAFDAERHNRCKELLKPEIENAPLMQTWYLFVHDPTGRKKARYTGDAFCDPDALWFLDYATEWGKVSITKYSPEGDWLYRVSFAKPSSDYLGAVMIPTFREKDGYLNFEWWETRESGQDRIVKRVMKVRLKEPIE